MKEGLIGGVVIASIIIAGIVGMMIIFEKPYGKAFQMKGLEDVTECACVKNGMRQSVLFAENYVLTQDGRVRALDELDPDLPECPQICAQIGSHI